MGRERALRWRGMERERERKPLNRDIYKTGQLCISLHVTNTQRGVMSDTLHNSGLIYINLCQGRDGACISATEQARSGG